MLKPNGKLYVEVPDISRSIRMLSLRTWERKKHTIRFLFGVDKPGNYHKSGFNYSILKHLLKETGFTNIRRVKQLAFKSEKGLRLTALKPVRTEYSWFKFISHFRSAVLLEFKVSTELLEVIENNCIPLFKELFRKTSAKVTTLAQKELTPEIIAICTLIHPKLAKLFNMYYQFEDKDNHNIELLNYLEKIDFPSILYQNWIKWKKELKEPIITWIKFMTHWKNKIKKAIKKEIDLEEHTKYALGTQIEEKIPFFSYEIVANRALKLANEGIRFITLQRYEEALGTLKKAYKLDPSNFLVLWQYGRILIGLKKDLKLGERMFRSAMRYCPRALRKEIKKDMNHCLNKPEEALKAKQVRF